MTAPLLAALGAGIYLAVLGGKALLALHYARRAERSTPAPAASPALRVAILQPILSGDADLANTLAANLRTLPNAEFCWLIDEDDALARALAADLLRHYSECRVTILLCAPAPQGINPKVHKLGRGLAITTAPVCVVLDDDTRLSAAGLDALLAGLATGSSLATGLPRYHAGAGRFSGWLAEFVNSAAVLTYLPVVALTEPISIHGMCYALRTAEAQAEDVFGKIARALTDDLALAQLIKKRGGRIVQTVQPHDIATAVPTLCVLGRILQRWFVFTRLLIDASPPRVRLALGATYLASVGPLYVLLGAAVCSGEAALLALGAMLGRELLLRLVKLRFLGSGLGSRPVISLLLELAQPWLLLSAYLTRTIQWRTRRLRVWSVDRFEYL
jgi:ceramide glucosyltransferase